MNNYIYITYYSNNTFNCEKFKIIYQNDEYIYFKRNGRNKLDYALKCEIREVKYVYAYCNETLVHPQYEVKTFAPVDIHLLNELYVRNNIDRMQHIVALYTSILEKVDQDEKKN